MRVCAVKNDRYPNVFEFWLMQKPTQRENIVNVLVACGCASQREREGRRKQTSKSLSYCFNLFQFWRRLGAKIKKRRKREKRDIYISAHKTQG
jgi:hypothetical protein